MVGIFQQGDGGVAHLRQIEAADLGGHAHGDALIGRHQHVGIGGGQQGRLLGGVVVVVHEVHGVTVQIPEQLGTDGGQLCLGVAAGGIGHVTGIDLAEVALAVHKGVQQRLVSLGQTHHGLVDGLIPVGVEAHGLAHDVGGLARNCLGKGLNLLVMQKIHIFIANLIKIIFPLDCHRRNFYPVSILPVASGRTYLTKIDFRIKVGCKCISVVSSIAVQNINGINLVKLML